MLSRVFRESWWEVSLEGLEREAYIYSGRSLEVDKVPRCNRNLDRLRSVILVKNECVCTHSEMCLDHEFRLGFFRKDSQLEFLELIVGQ